MAQTRQVRLVQFGRTWINPEQVVAVREIADGPTTYPRVFLIDGNWADLIDIDRTTESVVDALEWIRY